MENKKRGNPNWVKGVSGNPNGRPKNGQTMSELLKQIGCKVPPYPNKKGEPETRTYDEVLMERAYIIGCYGEERHAVSAMGFIRDTREGRPIERRELSTPEGESLKIEYISDNQEG